MSVWFATALATSARLSHNCACGAGIAQLVERNLAKVEVAGSNPVSRSRLLLRRSAPARFFRTVARQYLKQVSIGIAKIDAAATVPVIDPTIFG